MVRHNALTDPGAEIPGTMLGPDVETNVLRHGSVSIDLLRAMLWVSLCLSSVVQAAIDDRRWCETQTARFTLVSDLKPERLQPIADDLLRFHAVAELLVPQDTSTVAASDDFCVQECSIVTQHLQRAERVGFEPRFPRWVHAGLRSALRQTLTFVHDGVSRVQPLPHAFAPCTEVPAVVR